MASASTSLEDIRTILNSGDKTTVVLTSQVLREKTITDSYEELTVPPGCRRIRESG